MLWMKNYIYALIFLYVPFASAMEMVRDDWDQSMLIQKINIRRAQMILSEDVNHIRRVQEIAQKNSLDFQEICLLELASTEEYASLIELLLKAPFFNTENSQGIKNKMIKEAAFSHEYYSGCRVQKEVGPCPLIFTLLLQHGAAIDSADIICKSESYCKQIFNYAAVESLKNSAVVTARYILAMKKMIDGCFLVPKAIIRDKINTLLYFGYTIRPDELPFLKEFL
jgi:hypothetical protein